MDIIYKPNKLHIIRTNYVHLPKIPFSIVVPGLDLGVIDIKILILVASNFKTSTLFATIQKAEYGLLPGV